MEHMRQPLKDPSSSVGIGILISSSCINIRVAMFVEFQEKLMYELVNFAPLYLDINYFWVQKVCKSRHFTISNSHLLKL